MYKLEWVDGVDADADDFMFTTATGVCTTRVRALARAHTHTHAHTRARRLQFDNAVKISPSNKQCNVATLSFSLY